MTILDLTDVPYEQDIRELFMAFYPGEVFASGRSAEDRTGLRKESRRSEDDGTALKEVRDNVTRHLTGTRDGELYRFTLAVTDENSDADDGVRSWSSHIEDSRFETKCNIKKDLYEVLCVLTGRTLPWGTLTGIRPTRLILDRLDEGEDPGTVRRDFEAKFLPQKEKLDLCMETALREKKVLSESGEDGFSLYIGVPFCPTRCLYCSFTAYPISVWQEKTDAYTDTLMKEIQAVSGIMEGTGLKSVYMGGGTPTSLSAQQLSRIFEAVGKYFPDSGIGSGYSAGSGKCEFTVEAGRPDSITAEKLEAMHEYGVDRISVNPQTMNDETLKLIGRLHTTDMIREKFELARRYGFDNINTDIIIGLPGEDESHVEHTMRELEKLGPDSITVHSLAVKSKAGLAERDDRFSLHGALQISRMLDIASSACRQMGLSPYYMYRQKNMAGNFENVGYCTPGKECLYNIFIMEERQTIIGCGAGTSTKIALGHGAGVKRIENVRDPQLYMDRIDEMIKRKEVCNGTY